MLVAENVPLMATDQTKIFNLGRRMIHESSYLDRIAAEGELLRFVEDMVRKVEKRKGLSVEDALTTAWR